MKHRIQGYRLNMVKDRSAVYHSPHERLACASLVADVARDYLRGQPYESLLVMWVNAAHKLMGFQEVSRGGLAGCAAVPADVFRGAVLANARGIVLSHNHPSGDPSPSEDDIQMTRMVQAGGRILGIDLLDHVIVTPGSDYFSFAESEDW